MIRATFPAHLLSVGVCLTMSKSLSAPAKPLPQPLATTRSLASLIAPRSVAIIGASSDATRIGGRPIDYMVRRKFQGDIYPVNPNRTEIQGFKSYAAIADLPAAPDVAIIAVPAKSVLEAVTALALKGTGAAIIFSSGFAEADDAGAAEQDRIVAAARAHGMRLLGPNTLGAFNLRSGFVGTFMSSFEAGFPVIGRIGIASQSGAYCGHLSSVARARRIGISTCVMTGNEADLSLGEVIAELVESPDVDVIAAYGEGIKHGPAFARALEAARQARKPVIMMKVGRSAIGQAAAQSHTASIAGDDAVIDAVLAECGAVRARTTEEMLDIAHLATRKIYPANNTLGVMSVSGGAGVLISDAAELVGLAMPPLPVAAQAKLKALLPFAGTTNPVDCTAQVMNDYSLIGKFGQIMVGDGGYNSVLNFFTYVGGVETLEPKLRAEMAKIRDAYPERLYVLSVICNGDQASRYEADGMAVFEDPTRAVVAIHAMGKFGDAFARKPGLAAPLVPELTLPTATPNEAEAKALLAKAGIAAAPEMVCTSADDAAKAAEKFGFPVVLKIVSGDIVHKTEVGGVMLGVPSAAAVREGFATLKARVAKAAPKARIDGVLVAKQLVGGVECIMGLHRDPVFGPVVMFGLGGVFVEVLKDVVLRRAPFGVDVAEEMIRSIKGAAILLGARGRPPVDIKALAEMLARLSVVGAQAGESLVGVDLNPVLAMPAGQGAFAVDAVIEIAGAESNAH
jgi:acetate---CoA ligase (ADP-forming)